MRATGKAFNQPSGCGRSSLRAESHQMLIQPLAHQPAHLRRLFVAAIEEFDPITIVSLRYCGDASYSYYTASQQGHLYSTRSCKLESQSSGATCSWHKN